MFIRVCEPVHVYTCVSMCMFICVCVRMCMFIRVCEHVHVYMCL